MRQQRPSPLPPPSRQPQRRPAANARPQTRRRRPRRRRLRLPGLILLLLVAGASGYYGLRLTPQPEPAASPTAESTATPLAAAAPEQPAGNPFGVNPVRILLLGTDSGLGGTRTDTMILLAADLEHQHLGAVSIPRDTRVSLPNHGTHKINAAFGLGGIPLAAQAVANVTGVSIHHVALCDLAGFRKIVDELGGVSVNVEKRMRYTDRAQKLKIDLQPGQQVLNGDQAMQYVRFRKDAEGDLGRIARQQKFLRAVARSLTDPRHLSRLPKVLTTLGQNLETTLAPLQMVRLGQLLTQVPADQIATCQLPGEARMIGGVSYFLPGPTAAVAVDEVSRPAATAPAVAARPVVSVYNGSNRLGLERLVAERLREAGIPAVAAPQVAGRHVASTRVHGADAGALGAAQQVAATLHATCSSNPAPRDCPAIAVTQPGEAGVVVVLGDDYRE